MIPKQQRLLQPDKAAWLLAAGLLLLAVGYWGAWLSHRAAALNLLGIDLAEYVKFLPQVRSGEIALRREVFYGPLLALAVGLILLATLRSVRLRLALRVLLVVLAVPVTLAMLPPAWTPALLRTPEYRQQTILIALLLALALFSPLLKRFLPDWARGVLFVALAYLPLQGLLAFRRVLPAIEPLYRQPLQPGLAYYAAGAGAILLAVGGVMLLLAARRVGRKT